MRGRSAVNPARAVLRLPDWVRLGNDADVGRKRGGGAEVGGVAEFGDQACGGVRADAIDGSEQLADLMLAQFAVDVAIELAQATAQDIEVLAGVTHLDAVRLGVMASDGVLRRLDQRAGQFRADLVTSVVAQLGEALDRYAVKGGGRGIVMQDGARQFAVQSAHVAGELGEAEVDQAVQLSDAVGEVLGEPVVQADEFAQLLGGGLGQAGGGRALLRREARDTQGIDGVGLGALEILARRTDGCAVD